MIRLKMLVPTANTATAFAEPLRRVFAELYRPTKELTIDFHPESKYFVQSIEYKSNIYPLFERCTLPFQG